jgi:alkanesulfonate monooxygenase SsuD/methylene tetrahydromethanopterin reductase-like flavin-dependent oxidoreductase (luciferase family)
MFQGTVNLARRDNLTVRQLIRALGGGVGHRIIVGTPEQIADDIEAWFKAGAADGFNLMPDVLPTGLEIFVDTVVPILQKRGLFRTEYTGTTLREHFGLPRPASRFAKRSPEVASA